VTAGARTSVARSACNYHQNHPKEGPARKWNWLINAGKFLAKHETLEVALYIQTETTNLSVVDACRILEETRVSGETALVRAYRRLVIRSAREIIMHADMI